MFGAREGEVHVGRGARGVEVVRDPLVDVPPLLFSESGPLRAVHLSRYKWLGD